ncbi:MAG: hypothetical protein LBJ00_03510 [Planctomycetaceae bacterium]|jgi:hypothetical protein|nr:hypothetical protein [Planctomycetaceae bacterium]
MFKLLTHVKHSGTSKLNEFCAEVFYHKGDKVVQGFLNIFFRLLRLCGAYTQAVLKFTKLNTQP